MTRQLDARGGYRWRYPLGGIPEDRHTDPITAPPTPAQIAAHTPAHALCRRNVRRRKPPETRRPMALLALGLNGLVVFVLLFVG
jgi:hypothetical protein